MLREGNFADFVLPRKEGDYARSHPYLLESELLVAVSQELR